MVGLSGGPGGAGPLFHVAHALAPTSTFSLAHWRRQWGKEWTVWQLAGESCLYYCRAGSVAMYCRQHGYPTALLIFYKITGIRTLWGFGVTLSGLSITPCAGSESEASLGQVKPTTP